MPIDLQHDYFRTWNGPTEVADVIEPDVQLDAQPGVLYAAGNPDVFDFPPSAVVSRDGGASWQPFSLPRSPLAGIELALAADPLQPSKLVRLVCVVTATAGLPPLPVTSIAAGLSGPGRTLFAATAGAGAFVLTRP